MRIQRFAPRIGLVLGLLLPVACARVQGDQEQQARAQQARAPFELTADETRTARQLAEEDLAIPAQPSSALDRVLFIKIDLLPDSQAQVSQRQVNVIHYRYRGDETILTTVDLGSREVLNRQILPHFPTALAPEELTRARELARADARLQGVFMARRLHTEGRPLQAIAPQDPLFGHRVVHLLLREGNDYLTTPRVLVDLTTETVLVDDPADISK
jgi:hypothetical protein